MCGGFTLRLNPSKFLRVKEPGRYGPWKPIYNARPGEMLPIVTEEHPRQLTLAIWDFLPHWAKKEKNKGVINARAESVIEKPYFRTAFQRQRCIIPADGFYEWRKSGAYRQPFFFHRRDNKLFNFAGVYDRRPDRSGNVGFAIITTNSNSVVTPVHNRMPVMLEDDEVEQWLSGATKMSELIPLLHPYTAAAMDSYPVSVLVNSARNKGPEVLERLTAVDDLTNH